MELGDLTIPFAVLRLLSEELRTILYEKDYRAVDEINDSMETMILTKVSSDILKTTHKTTSVDEH